MGSDKATPMNRYIRKISVISLACLLMLNVATGAAVSAGHCQLSMDAGSPMDMDHCDGLLKFAFPAQGCCGNCFDIFCDLMKNPLQDANTANTLTFQTSFYPSFLGTINAVAESDDHIALSEQLYLLRTPLEWRQIPLYIENLSLII